MEESFERRIEFAYGAINDTQSTIRAVDGKLGTLVAVQALGVPATALVIEWCALPDRPMVGGLPAVALAVVASIGLVSLFFAVVIAIRGIAATTNPADMIDGAGNVTGSYYAPGLFTFQFRHALLNPKKVVRPPSLQAFLATLPTDHLGLLRELCFEHLKLAFIRDLKIARQRAAFLLSTVWVTTVIAAVVISLWSSHTWQ